MAHPPSHYLRRMFFDSLVYSPAGLRKLIDQVGIDQVVIGTDYPFDMGHYDIHALIGATAASSTAASLRAVSSAANLSTATLSTAQCAAILGGNAARLLALPGFAADPTRNPT